MNLIQLFDEIIPSLDEKCFPIYLDLHHYFNYHVCLSGVCHKKFFSLKLPWNHPLTFGSPPGVILGERSTVEHGVMKTHGLKALEFLMKHKKFCHIVSLFGPCAKWPH